MATRTALIQFGNVGTTLEVVLVDEKGEPLDVSDPLDTLEIHLRSPDAAAALDVKTPTPATDGSDGRVEYVTVAGDLDAAGSWKIQAKAVLASGEEYFSAVGEFEVAPNLY